MMAQNHRAVNDESFTEPNGADDKTVFTRNIGVANGHVYCRYSNGFVKMDKTL